MQLDNNNYIIYSLNINCFAAVLIIFCGAFINGPYALITTAVSNDLVCKKKYVKYKHNFISNCVRGGDTDQ